MGSPLVQVKARELIRSKSQLPEYHGKVATFFREEDGASECITEDGWIGRKGKGDILWTR